MENNSDKPWTRPWTTKEMVENASNWSLAADVGLLKHLEEFSNNLLKKSEETSAGLDGLLQNLTNVSLSLEIAKSKFLSLQNTQFIENRVYEDDETEIVKIEEVTQEKKITDAERKEAMKNAVTKGLQILDKYFDKVEVPASDSEEDDSTSSFVLRPKDPYLSRQVPYIIGTEEWHKKWHVGLVESSSDSEAEKVSEKYSDTESEVDLPVVNRGFKTHAADAVSEDYSEKLYIDQAAGNSTIKHSDSYTSSDNEETNSVSFKPPAGPNVFAEELAAKLGNVLIPQTSEEPEVNKRPIQKITSSVLAGDFFDNEPPPFEETNQEDSPSSDRHGIFSGSSGLFDDLEDEHDSFWNQTPIVKKNLEDQTSKLSKRIFDDDDIFTKAKKDEYKVESQTFDPDKTAIPKKPVGGIQVVPTKNLFSSQKDYNLLKKRQVSSESSEDENENPKIFQKPTPPTAPLSVEPENVTPVAESKQNTPIKKEEIKRKEISLFSDDDSDIFNDDLFSTIKPKKFTSDLFSGDDFLPNVTPAEKSEIVSKGPEDIFDNFNKKTESPQDMMKVSTDSTDIFDDLIKSESLVENKPKSKTAENTPIEASTNVGKESNINQSIVEKKKIVSLFDDDDDDLNDDLFNSFTPLKQNKKNTISQNNLFSDEPLFFNNNPPEIKTNNFEAKEKLEGNLKLEPSAELEINTKLEENSKLEDHKKLEPNGKIEATEKLTTNDKLVEGNDIINIVELKKEEDYQSKNTGTLENEKVEEGPEVNQDVNDFASVIQSTVQKVHSNYSNGNIFEEPPPLPNSTFKTPNPDPEFDYDDWDTRADDNYDNDLLSYEHTESDIIKSSDIFASEPPSLFGNKFIETTGFGNKEPLSSLNDQKDDLFGEISKEDSIKTPAIDNRNILDNVILPEELQKVVIVPKMKESESSKADTQPLKKPALTKKPTKLDLSKEFSIKEGVRDEKEIKSPPGKLKHNLNINVNALLPGLGPPRKKDFVTPVSSGSFDEDITGLISPEFENTASAKTSSTVSSPGLGVKKDHDISTLMAGLNNNIDKIEVLQSVTKDRAKPLNRRPSTRRARQEQLRKSGIDFNYPTPEDDTTDKKNLVDTNSDSFSDKPSLKKQVSEETIVATTSDMKQPNIGQEKVKDKAVLSEKSSDIKLNLEVENLPSGKLTGAIPKSLKKGEIIDADDIFADQNIKETDQQKHVPAQSNTLDNLFTKSNEQSPEFTDIFDEQIQQNLSKKDIVSKESIKTAEQKLLTKRNSSFNDIFEDHMFAKSLDVKNTDVSKNKDKKVTDKPSKNMGGSKFLFDEEDSDNDLFPTLTKVTKLATKTVTKEAEKKVLSKLRSSDQKKTESIKGISLFDEDEDSDDIFSTKKTPPKPSNLKKSLFDDDLDEEDDLFEPKSRHTVKSTTREHEDSKTGERQRKTLKTSNIKKLESATVKDPLDAFRN